MNHSCAHRQIETTCHLYEVFIDTYPAMQGSWGKMNLCRSHMHSGLGMGGVDWGKLVSPALCPEEVLSKELGKFTRPWNHGQIFPSFASISWDFIDNFLTSFKMILQSYSLMSTMMDWVNLGDKLIQPASLTHIYRPKRDWLLGTHTMLPGEHRPASGTQEGVLHGRP